MPRVAFLLSLALAVGLLGGVAFAQGVTFGIQGKISELDMAGAAGVVLVGGVVLIKKGAKRISLKNFVFSISAQARPTS